MRIPCVVVMENEVTGEICPVFFTATYWGAKRIRLRIEKVNQSFHVSIFEVWNLPSVLKGWVR
jgi:hypothetical protein